MYIGSHCKRCTLAALDLATGTIVWSVGLSTRIEAAPCLSKCGRYVIVGRDMIVICKFCVIRPMVLTDIESDKLIDPV